MKDQFYLHFDTMPAGTSQQKRYDGRTGRYYKDAKLLNLEKQFAVALRPHKPAQPCTRPVKLVVWFAWDTKDKKLWKTVKPTRPDTDNYIKTFKDVMTYLGFWKDDSQVVAETIYKTYAENATIMVSYSEVMDKSDAFIRKEVEND